MSTRRDKNQGLTLIELLIVLAIVGLLTSVAIPFVIQAGLLSGNKSNLAGRELFNMLRAAKVYAGTYNVDTALAYSVRTVDDSFSFENVGIVDAMGLVRRLKRAELSEFGFNEEDELYAPVGTGDGVFNFMANDSCLLQDLFFEYNPRMGELVYADRALSRIVIIDLNREVLEPMRPRLNANLAPDSLGIFMDNPNDQSQYAFPAHVFNPSGEVTGFTAKQRVKLRVGPLPTADPDERFVNPALIINPDNIHDPANLIHTEVTLYTAMGRVKVAS